MSIEHTPTPWTYDPVWNLILGPNGEEIAAIHSGVCDGKRQSARVAAINGPLMAAAPELLAALELCLVFLPTEAISCAAKANLALAKATQ